MNYEELEYVTLVKFYNAEFLTVFYHETHPAVSLELLKDRTTGEKVYCVNYYPEYDPEDYDMNVIRAYFSYDDYLAALEYFTDKLLVILHA